MAESNKVRLVRCPKCENLLPELADYSVYQCGGCGAVLRAAKIRNREADTSPEKFEKDRLGGVSSRSQVPLEKGIVDLSDASDADVKSSDGSLRCDQTDAEKEKNVDCIDTRRNESKVAGDKRPVENATNSGRNKDVIVDSVEIEQKDSKSNFGYTVGSQRSGQMSDWLTGKQGQMPGLQRIPKAVVEGLQFSTSNHPEEGSSDHHLDSSCAYNDSLQSRTDQDGSNRIQLEQERAELLMKLDELKERLSRSCNVVDKPKEKATFGRVVYPESYGGADSLFPSGSSGSNKPSMPLYGPDKHAAGAGPSYYSQLPEPLAYPVGHDTTRHGLYPPMHNPNHIPPYRDPFESQMLGRAPPHLFPREYPQQPPHPYFSGQYMESNRDPFMSYPQSSMLHQASCSCFHCYEKHRRAAAPVPHSSFGNKRFPDVPCNPIYHIENPGTFGSHFHSSRTTMPQPSVLRTQAHARWPGDINSDIGGFVQCHPQRVMVASGGRRFRPIAGGAPFILCYNCFELLQMPRKVQLNAKTENKLRCGACSSVINFTVTDKKLVLHDHMETKGISGEVDDISDEVVIDSSSYFRGRANRTAANFSSNDYDISGYDFQSMDGEPIASSTGQVLNSIRSQEMRSFHSSSPSVSEDDNIADVLTDSREEVKSIQQQIKSTVSPPAGSPLQEHFDYSSGNHAADRLGKGNRSNCSDQEKFVSNKTTMRQNSLKEALLPTEMEVSYDEYSNTEISPDSGEATREYHSKAKSFKDFSRSNQTEGCRKSNVSVNGHPIPERVLKNAEKMTGPIQPGHYWYDFRAGFWGVLGGPCLGIIPPFIEEFNYPMPENCAGGTTGVFVNGRELHQKDLDLLANRGLPTDRDRSYIIEISGRVLDEDTGEELDCLGKLAPTVEKAKHGFGMKVPKSV
ncbi:protein ENHANCED DISEASE RESISTANCE 4-like isoform X1 [Hibiscus syriacus]|uniref:protein ENHANCED DISEASE RESISTANCE 4-like isoform X1 n=1 Tax=Hibiscus syriacus TaxID=106335 RepID=UPI001922F795|nr:protein ENHANCED DISEASE RESISTANCE 4-like isoform X1 [Hibiscus syriacus]